MSARRRRRSSEEKFLTDAVLRLSKTPQGRKFLVVIVILGLIGWVGWQYWQRRPHSSTPALPAGPTARIATWNLRQFSPDRKTIDLRAIADIIQTSKFELLAVQEVKREGEMVDRLLNTLGPPWRATAFSPMTGNYERFVFLYNGDHVQEVERPHLIADPAAVFDRTPCQGTFRIGNFDFTLITAHLSYTDAPRRRREAEALARYAADLAATSAEKDVIALGDFNEQRGSRANLSFFLDRGWTSLNHDPSNLGSVEIFDTLLIDQKHTREWTGAAGAVKFDETRYANNDKEAVDRVSDHRPVYADFATNLPDDD